MFQTDLSQIRQTRQFITNQSLAEVLCYTDFEESDLKKYINFKSLDRLAELSNYTRQEVYDDCKDNYTYALSVAHGCAILASRQGSKDESFVLTQIDKHTSQNGIYVKPLNNQDLRPTKDGRLFTLKEYKKSGLSKLDCLKSIDGVISGKVEGYVFAKIVFGEGGHQDNVFHEAAQFADWVQQYGDTNKIYVLLIDTDLTNKYNELVRKYDNNNLWVVNHVEFQERLNGIS